MLGASSADDEADDEDNLSESSEEKNKMGHSLGKPKGATVKNDPDLVEKVHRTCQKFQEMVEKAKMQVRMTLKKASGPKVFRCYTIYSISLSIQSRFLAIYSICC